jgi:TonB family protein
MKTSAFNLVAIVIAATLILGGGAHGQREVPIGSFVERITTVRGEEWSVLFLSPTRAQPDTVGRLLWGCSETGALVFGIRGPAAEISDTRTPDMIWTFDADPPDTAGIQRLSSSRVWGLGAEAAVAFTRRAKTAARLVIRLPVDSFGPDAVYEYDLAGADSALDRLECVRNPRPVREASATVPASPAASTPPDEQTFELAGVEELPRPTNMADFHRALRRGYPPSLRQARVSGMVQVRFRLLEDGRVDPESITITRSDNEQFNDPTRRVIRALQFSPAKVNGRPVKVWIEMPITWTPPGRR